MNCFERLGIEETTDIKTIKAAYAGLLPKYSPESDPEGFQLLRVAYEEAQSFAKGERSEPEKTPLDAFMERFDACYSDFVSRLDEQCWKKLLEDPLCHHIDSVAETEGRIIDYLNDHYHYPHSVWRVFNDTFGWLEQRQRLNEQYSESFIDFILDKVREKSTVEYLELLSIARDAESFLAEHAKACRGMDNSDYFQVWSAIEKMEQLLPGQTNLMVLKGRYHAALNRLEEADQCFETLLKKGIENLDVYFYAGSVRTRQGRLEDAKDLYRKALEIKTDSNGSAYYFGRCCMGLHQYTEAAECFRELFERLPANQEVGLLFAGSCRFAIRQLEENSGNLPEAEKLHQLARLNYLAGETDSCLELLKKLQATGPLDSRQNCLLGKAAHASGNTEEALRAFDEALKQTPEDADVLMAKAGCLHDTGRYDECVALYERVIQRVTADTMVFNNLAHALIKVGRYDEALHYCNQAISTDSDYAWAYKNRALARFRMERFEDCLSDCEHAISLQPQLVESYVVQMEALNELGRYSQVHQLFSRAMDNGIQHVDLIMQKANAYRLDEEYGDAITGYEKILEMEPENGEAHLHRGHCLYYMKKYPEAIEAFERALHCGGDPLQSYLMKGWSLFKQEQYNEVRQCLTEAIDRNLPEQDRLYNLIGEALVQMEKNEEALSSYQKCVEINPDCHEYHFGVGFCLSNLERFEESLKHLNRAQEISPRFQDSLITKSYVLFRLRRYHDAVAVCNTVLTMNAASETAIRNKSWALYKLSDLDAAMETLNKGLRLCGELEHFLNLKVLILRDRNKLHDALAVTNRFLELYPDSEDARSHYNDLDGVLNKKSLLQSIFAWK